MFGAVSLTKNDNIDKYKFPRYGIEFDRKGKFSVGNGFGINCISFGEDISSSIHVDNKKKYIKSWWRYYTKIRCMKKSISVNFTENNKKIWLSWHYNGANSYLFVNSIEIIKFKTKDSENVVTPLCLKSISKDFSVDNMKKTGLNG